MTRLLLSAAAALVGAITLHASDWPQWRGPDRSGVSKETGLLKTWPKDGPPKVWTVAGCGGGFSSVVVADGVIYGTGSARGKNIAWARNESDGKVIWSQPVCRWRPEPNSTPVIAAGKLYVLSKEGVLLVFDAKTGNTAWRVSYTSDF